MQTTISGQIRAILKAKAIIDAKAKTDSEYEPLVLAINDAGTTLSAINMIKGMIVENSDKESAFNFFKELVEQDNKHNRPKS
jgi:hypothetical protein